MLVVGSEAAVVVHSASSSAVLVTASEHWVSASKAAAIASRIGVLHLHWHLRPVHLWWLGKLVRL
jgi:hypothetical protein